MAFSTISAQVGHLPGMRLKLTLAAAALATSAFATTALAALPSAQAWEIGPWVRGKNYSVGMPERPAQARNGGLAVEFPRMGQGEWDAMTTPIGPLAGARAITVRYRIDAGPRTRFVAVETPDRAATVSLYFPQAGAHWTGRDRFASYRGYAPLEQVMELPPGEHVMRVPIDGQWTNVMGKPRSEQAAGFRNALRETATLGLAFGSVTRRSHGVAATGPATFTLLDVSIER